MSITMMFGIGLLAALLAFVAYARLVPSPYRRKFPADVGRNGDPEDYIRPTDARRVSSTSTTPRRGT